jgi:hypothetical protein
MELRGVVGGVVVAWIRAEVAQPLTVLASAARLIDRNAAKRMAPLNGAMKAQ